MECHNLLRQLAPLGKDSSERWCNDLGVRSGKFIPYTLGLKWKYKHRYHRLELFSSDPISACSGKKSGE